ncbi:MAG: ATP-binding protein [Lachnospiraceae bacterium]
MKKITLPAKQEFLYEAIDFVGAFAKENGLKEGYNRVELTVEEVFSNIAAYAYLNSEGTVQINCWMEDGSLVMEFIDSGVAYNPLEQLDPDISLPAEIRPIGGLGIYFVKSCMDFMGYERKAEKNILTLKIQMEDKL